MYVCACQRDVAPRQWGRGWVSGRGVSVSDCVCVWVQPAVLVIGLVLGCRDWMRVTV